MLFDLLPARARKTLYALFAFASAVAPTVIAVLDDGWQWDQDFPILLASVITAGGFKLAHDNTQP